MKTEKEKMLAGEPYNPGDPALLERWHEAKRLLRLYEQTPTTDRARLTEILGELLGSHGDGVWITAPFFADYGDNIHLGSNCEINANCVFLDCNTITIGDNALIAPGVHIYTAYHPLSPRERFGDPSSGDFAFCKTQAKPVVIGDNVWIGGGSIIMPGIRIGNGVTIGAGSVVTKDIPDGVLAFGNPCRVIREID
ncbi:sugar O-acetyltransferase [Rhodopirellula sp. JC740]|uniref:Sugar O-acetyltransferase n=1 Tax=Rhodopirellula halodulae TaxID=2894198 RepID=A0ABS8NLL2_9BACT|nr:sugar O-acetyltransferase [Rhodopirellula sp. JC740]